MQRFGEIKSIWRATTYETDYPRLKKDLKVDVVVIGGGMAGLSIAYSLTKQGLKVAVLEGGRIASATSGNTTAKITSLHGLRYASLAKKFGLEKAQIYASSNQWAVEEIEYIIRKEEIDCDFYMAPAFTYTSSKAELQNIIDELNMCLQLSLPASYEIKVDSAKIKVAGAVKFEDQAYFHPRKYLLKLAEIINESGGLIFENSRALGVEERNGFCIVSAGESKVTAKAAVVATNFPFYDPDKIFVKLHRAGSFVIAATPAGDFADVMYIGTQGMDMSFRPHKDGDRRWLIVGARHDEKPGDNNLTESINLLVKLAKKNFQVKSIDYQWGATDTMSSDNVPYIGLFPRRRNVYVATAFSAWGMTPSVVSAKLIGDLILGKKNDWESLYDPQRLLIS